MKKVLFLTACDEARQQWIRSSCGDAYEIEFGGQLTGDARRQAIAEAHIIVGEPDYMEIAGSDRLEWVQMTWAGTDKYTYNGPFPDDVILTSASGAFGIIMSEYIIGGIIALYRRLPEYYRQQEQRFWKPLDTATELYGKRVLILGTGDIGSNTARRLQAFGCRITGLCRHPRPMEGFDEVKTMDELAAELPEADIIIGALPNNSGTRDLITCDSFSHMKQTAIFVNVGRGTLVEEYALERAMDQNLIAGAVVDVHRHEPLAREDPLWQDKRVIITPHIAGPGFVGTETTDRLIYQICIDNLLAYAAGEKLKNIVEH